MGPGYWAGQGGLSKIQIYYRHIVIVEGDPRGEDDTRGTVGSNGLVFKEG